MIQGTKVVILNPPDIEKPLQRVITELNDSGKRVISISSANCKCKLDTCTVEIS